MNRIQTYSSAFVIALSLGSLPAIADIDSAISGTADVDASGTLMGNQNGSVLNGGLNGEITGDSTLSTTDNDDIEDPEAPDGDSPFENNAPDISPDPASDPDSDQPEIIDTESADSRQSDDRTDFNAGVGVGVDLDLNSSVNSDTDSMDGPDSMDAEDDDVIDSEPVPDEDSNEASGSLSTRTEVAAEANTSESR